MESAYILIVEDHKNVKDSLIQTLQPHFDRVEGITNPNLLVSGIDRDAPDVILLDMNFSAGFHSGNEGLYWLKEIKERSPAIEVITITAYGDIELAVKAIKEGAHDFIQKPWENEILISTITTAVKLKRSQEQVAKLREQREDLLSIINYETEPVIGESEPMKHLMELAGKVAPTGTNVLITGENGTGKGLLARYLHNLSERRLAPFVTVDLGSLPETLFESELFGHTKGAFTGAGRDRKGRLAAAHKGTLFLDEIGNIPVSLQGKLLTAIESGSMTPLGSDRAVTIDVRLICATNRNLKEMVGENLFREDLFFRINTIELKVPPLRERADDLPLLINHYLNCYSNKYGKAGIRFTSDAWDLLLSYSWPGNIRELQHHIEKGVILGEKGIIRKKDIRLFDIKPDKQIPMSLHEIEKKAIISAVNKHNGSIREAAAELKVSRQTLYNKIKKYGI